MGDDFMNDEIFCEGVVECTALVLAESCTEFDGRHTLFGVLDEIRPAKEGGTSFVAYAKFEGCATTPPTASGTPASSYPTTAGKY
ncbi:MAG: hypothetical protein H0U65_06905 [Rubrobacter sp.]|nr:hypothetical protein [Rubrobacter sp.]